MLDAYSIECQAPEQSNKRIKNIMTICVMSFTLSACMTLPKTVTDREITEQLSVPQTFQTSLMEEAREIESLTSLFKDPTIDQLVTQALQNNPDILIAAQKIEEAGYHANAKWGDIFPQISGNMATHKGKAGAGSYSPTLDVSWEMDLWGKLLNQKSALDIAVQIEAENYSAMRHSITAQVIQAWFDTVTTAQIVFLEQDRLANLKKSLINSLANYEAGLGTLDDLDAVKRDIAQTQASLMTYRDNENTAVRSLKLLLGQYPDPNLALTYVLPALDAPPAAGIPADLLTGRPDLRQAWQEVLRSDKNVQSTHKEIWPSLTLTGALGTQSTSFENLMSGATIWSLASQLAVPIFNAGQLKNNVYAAQSQAEQAWLSYLKTALVAFQEVEQALDRETLLAEQEKEQEKAVHYAENTARIFEERYKNGLISILEYLTAQNTVYDMKASLLNIRNQRLKNRVALALALGKGA